MEGQRRVCIVTGAANGVGKGIALHFLRHDYNVVVADIDAAAGQRFLDDYQAASASSPTEAFFVETNVGDEESVKRMVEKVTAKFGRIDCLINNAAMAYPYFRSGSSLEDVSFEEWRRFMNVNLDSIFLCCKYAVPYLKKSPSAAIINISSTRHHQSEPNTEAYCATKGGVVSMTHALASTLGAHLPKKGEEQAEEAKVYPIRVNCISPGWISVPSQGIAHLTEVDHKQHPAGRVGRPEDVGKLALFLAREEESGFITGQNFFIDGGITKKMIYLSDFH
ncbi:putative Shortchain dehydrogenase/reductase SDR [Balamuthia mandrillaris]